jgi:MFS transporter, MHS family, alpha-ketoglutarate permease
MRAWGWRIPFVIGAMLAIIALMIRSTLHETEAFIEARTPQRHESSVRTLFKYPRQVLIVVGLTAGGTTAFYTYTTYMQKFLKLSVGLSDNQTTLVSAGSLIFALCLQPIYGALSDRIGRKPLLIWFGLMGAVFTVPLLRSLQSAKSAGGAFILIAAAWLIVAGYTSINAVVKAELFPTRVRATGVGLPFAITTSIFGGPAESIALWFKSIGHEMWFPYYLSSVIAITLIVSITMRDTKRYSALDRHD